MFKRIDHVELVLRNPDKTLDFYVDVLGFKLKSRQVLNAKAMREIIYLTLGDTMVELIVAQDPVPLSKAPFQSGYRAIALEVDDMDAAVEYLKGKGVALSSPVLVMGGTKRAEIKDPNGFPIELRQW